MVLHSVVLDSWILDEMKFLVFVVLILHVLGFLRESRLPWILALYDSQSFANF